MDTEGQQLQIVESTSQAGLAAMQARQFKIPGDVVNRATAGCTDRERSAIRWLHAYAMETDSSMTQLGKLLHYDASNVYRVLTGKYDGKLDNIVSEIERFRKLQDERSKHSRIDFVETAMARKIWKLCDAALEFSRVGFMFGEIQIGKTKALERYRDDHNHGSTILVRMPTGGSLTIFLSHFAVALRISPKQNEKELRHRIIEAFDDRMLLIVDECHQCVIGGGDTTRPLRTIEFVREVFDRTKCGLIICATNVLRKEMEGGAFAGILRQLYRRRLAVLQLPDMPTAEDLQTFARAFGLQPPTGEALRLQTEVIRDEGLGMWLTFLRSASKIANKDKRPMAWQHVIRAHAGLKALEQMSR